MQNQKMPAFEPTTLRSLSVVFPYIGKVEKMNARDYKLLSKAQKAEEMLRRKAFVARLDEYKLSFDTVRSFPTPVLDSFAEPEIDWDDETLTQTPCDQNALLAHGKSLGYQINVAQDEPVVTAAPPSSDDCPYEAPPLDPSQYSSVQVDDEYDTTGPTAPDGNAGQPDVYDWSKATVGVVTNIGCYPYRYEKGKSKTHMVRVGTQDHWGVDLERVVREFGLKKGDKIALMSIGKQPVIVPEKVRQEDGSIKTVEKSAMRNTWVAKRLS